MVNHKGDAAHNEINSFASKAAKYKREGDAHFGKRNMREALTSYGKAIEMSLTGTEEKAALYSNRAACYLMQNMYRAAVQECSQALNEAPDFKPALLRRARAYEQMQQYDRAVSDLEAAAKADPGSDDVRKKLQATRAARDTRKASRAPQGLGGGGLRVPSAGSASPPRSSRLPRRLPRAKARARCPR
jgi:tetratricopeptide (TPR) repeat protein